MLCIPKEKIQVVIILKKMELLTLKPVSLENSVNVILTMLEIISNCNVKMIHSLKIKSAIVPKEQKATERTIEKQSSKRD